VVFLHVVTAFHFLVTSGFHALVSLYLVLAYWLHTTSLSHTFGFGAVLNSLSYLVTYSDRAFFIASALKDLFSYQATQVSCGNNLLSIYLALSISLLRFLNSGSVLSEKNFKIISFCGAVLSLSIV